MRYISLNTNRQFNMEFENAQEERNKTMKKNTIETVKSIASVVISLGVGTVVGNILHTTTPKNAGKLMKSLAYIGGMCIESIVVAHAQVEAEEKIDMAVENIRKATSEDDTIEVATEE